MDTGLKRTEVPTTDTGLKNLELSHRNYNTRTIDLTTAQQTIILDHLAERIILKT